jgi:hypothetical protein
MCVRRRLAATSAATRRCRKRRAASTGVPATILRHVPHGSATQSEGEHDQQSVFH